MTSALEIIIHYCNYVGADRLSPETTFIAALQFMRSEPEYATALLLLAEKAFEKEVGVPPFSKFYTKEIKEFIEEHPLQVEQPPVPRDLG